MSSRYGGRGGSTWKPSGNVSGTDWFTTDGATQKRKTRKPRKPKGKGPTSADWKKIPTIKAKPKISLTATKADRISPSSSAPKGPGALRRIGGRGVQAGAITAVGFLGSKLDKADMYALRKSQRYLKANPMVGSPELGGDNPKKGYMGRATWKANTRRAIEDMNKFDNRPSVPLSNAGSNAPVSTRPQRPASSPVAKSKFEQKIEAAIGRFTPRKAATPKPAASKPLATRTVSTHPVDKLQKGKSQTRIAFEKKFAAERKKQGAGGTFKFTNPVTGKTGTYTTDYKKPNKPKQKKNRGPINLLKKR